MTDIDYDALKKDRFERNVFSKYLGIVPVEVREGYSQAFLKMKQEYKNIGNSVHGGVLYTLADVTANCAAVTYGDVAVTSTADFHYLNSAKEATDLRAEAFIIKRGRKIITAECKVYDEKDRLLTASIFTFCVVE